MASSKQIVNALRVLLASLHPKVKFAAKVASILVAVDGVVVALMGVLPQQSVVLAVLFALHAALPVTAAYVKQAAK